MFRILTDICNQYILGMFGRAKPPSPSFLRRSQMAWNASERLRYLRNSSWKYFLPSAPELPGPLVGHRGASWVLLQGGATGHHFCGANCSVRPIVQSGSVLDTIFEEPRNSKGSLRGRRLIESSRSLEGGLGLSESDWDHIVVCVELGIFPNNGEGIRVL